MCIYPTSLLPLFFVALLSGGLCTLAQAPPWQTDFQAATQQLQRGDTAAAEARLAALFKAHAQDYQLAAQIGAALDMSGQHRSATAWYLLSLKLNPSYAPAQHNLSLNYASMGEFAKALALLEGLVRRNPNDAKTLYNLGLVRLQLKRYGTAAQAFQRVRQIEPGNRDALVRFAWASLHDGNRAQGLAALRTILESPGDRREAALQVTQILNSARMYKEALAQVEALAPSAGSPELSFENATALFHLGELRRAADTLVKASIPAGRERDYYLLAGSALALSGDLPAAVESMQAAVAADPHSAETYYRLALVFIQGGRREEARNVISSGLEQLPASALLWYGKGVTYLEWGKDEEVISCLDESLRLDPAQSDAWSLMGELQAQIGDYDKALKAYGKALNPDADPETSVKYAELLVRLERYDEAGKVLRERLRVSPSMAHVYRGLGRLYKAQHQYGHALENLQKAVELDPEDADSHFQLGETLRWLGRVDEARSQYALANEKKIAAAAVARLLRRVIVPAGAAKP